MWVNIEQRGLENMSEPEDKKLDRCLIKQLSKREGVSYTCYLLSGSATEFLQKRYDHLGGAHAKAFIFARLHELLAEVLHEASPEEIAGRSHSIDLEMAEAMRPLEPVDAKIQRWQDRHAGVVKEMETLKQEAAGGVTGNMRLSYAALRDEATSIDKQISQLRSRGYSDRSLEPPPSTTDGSVGGLVWNLLLLAGTMLFMAVMFGTVLIPGEIFLVPLAVVGFVLISVFVALKMVWTYFAGRID